jgi:P27 family predicted phage terminase small subunit
MTRGRRPKPAEIRRREGGTGASGAVSHRPMPVPMRVEVRTTAPEFPPELPAEARDLWDFEVTRLFEAGIADVTDIPALRMMCLCYSRVEKARRVLAEDGMVSLGSTGQLVEHPMLQVEHRERLQLLRWFEQFGLTASARARLGLTALQGSTLKAELEQTLGRRR